MCKRFLHFSRNDKKYTVFQSLSLNKIFLKNTQKQEIQRRWFFSKGVYLEVSK